MPQRFDLTYVGSDGEKHTPIMIHRVIFGSIERFIGILTEHFAGKFPLWLAPVQVKLLTVTEKFNDYAEEVGKWLRDAGLRVEVDVRNEKIGYKNQRSKKRKGLLYRRPSAKRKWKPVNWRCVPVRKASLAP